MWRGKGGGGGGGVSEGFVMIVHLCMWRVEREEI